MSLSTSVERRDSASIVSLRGELDIAFLDSTGVRVLLAVDLRARDRGMRFGVVRGDGMVARLLEVTGIDQRVAVFDDPAELLDGASPG
jgi:anti-anti-sigma regulatory factor